MTSDWQEQARGQDIMRLKKINPEIIYEDNSIIVCIKPAGVPVQTSRPGTPDLVSALKNYRAGNHQEPYIGVIHRLDQPVSGIMVFAKTKSAAASLSKQISSRQTIKEYLAVICGTPAPDPEHQNTDQTPGLPASGEFRDYLLRDGKTNTSQVVPEGTPGAKEALLSYEILQTCPDTGRSLVRITLHTGRHHQIRVQFAHAGFPLYADTKYGHPLPGGAYCPVALCSFRIGFIHPETGRQMDFTLERKYSDSLLDTRSIFTT